MDYKKAGVDIEAGYKSVELMKEHVKRTMREEVLGGLGGFSGAFSLKKIKDMDDPVLLSGTDGCGTNHEFRTLRTLSPCSLFSYRYDHIVRHGRKGDYGCPVGSNLS